MVTKDTFFVTRRANFADLVTRQKVPAMFSLRAYVADGGSVSYGIDLQTCIGVDRKWLARGRTALLTRR